MNIFPTIFRVFKVPENDSKHYIEMERFDNDITYLIMNILPKKVIDEMGRVLQIKEDLFALFQYKIPSTFDQNVMGWRLQDINDVRIDTIIGKFKSSNLTYAIYTKFINLYKRELDKILPIINDQLFILRSKLGGH